MNTESDGDHDDYITMRILPDPLSASSSSSLSQNHSLIYIHVGKTGGISLDKVLHSNCMWYFGKSAREGCLDSLQQQQQQEDPSAFSTTTRISDLTKATLHFGPRKDYNDWIHNASLFLITLRNPIDRTISAYNFDHPKNHDPSRYGDRGLPQDIKHFFVDCFPLLQDLTMSLKGVGKFSFWTRKKKRDCHDMAVQALAGNGSITAVPHLHMNYNYYHELTTALYPSRPVLAIRTEFLWYDLEEIDRMLGGDGVFPASGMTYTHGSSAFRVKDKGLSASDKQIFCCHLITELQLYQDLIERSINLYTSEKREVIDPLYQDCGRSTDTMREMSWRRWEEMACT